MYQGNDERTENGPQDGAGATAQGGTADDGGRNDAQLRAHTDGGAAVPVERQRHHRRDANNEAHQGHHHDARAGNANAGEECRLAIAADGLHPAAKRCVIEEDPAQDADDQHGPDADPDAEDRITATDPGEEPGFQVVPRNRRSIADDQAQAPVEAERAEGDDDGGDAERDAERAVDEATQGGDDHADGDGYPDVVVVPQRDGHHHAAEHPDRTDREVDVSHGDDENHPHRHDADIGGLARDIDEVLRGKELVPGQDGKERDQDDERSNHADLIDLQQPLQDGAPTAGLVIPDRDIDRRFTHEQPLCMADHHGPGISPGSYAVVRLPSMVTRPNGGNVTESPSELEAADAEARKALASLAARKTVSAFSARSLRS